VTDCGFSAAIRATAAQSAAGVVPCARIAYALAQYSTSDGSGGIAMDEQNLNRRQLLGGMAAGTAGLLGALQSPAAGAAEYPTPDMGLSQAPPITDVKDKVAYITGGSSGIGLGIARALHEAGARVILGNYNDKQFADALSNFPANDPRVATVVQDVMERDAWERKADEIEKKFGHVHILVNNAGVGLFSKVTDGTLKDWDWGMGVNFWGPVYGVRTFVPRMLAHKEGSHIVTTTSTDGVLGTAGIYAVSKLAAAGLMEQLRHELHTTNIGTSNLVPGMTTSNLGRSESEYRPAALRNDPPPGAPAAGARPAGPRFQMPTPPPNTPPLWARPQSALTVGRLVVNGILNNDMWIYPAPEYRVGLQARCDAMVASMVDYSPMPENIAAGHDRYYRTPIYVQEIAHRQATKKRNIPGV
jgi:NAD(P)-dependent dehydrogenase (short-subunit alcohol dehydrogenase family)